MVLRSTRTNEVGPGAGDRPGALHVHWFRWAGSDPTGNGSHYSCRCGAARPGL